jgi:hypothetical protein
LVQAGRALQSATRAIDRHEKRVNTLEDQLNISSRWSPTTPEYIDVERDLTYRKYRLALDDLERLVVQRLFELTKLNILETGTYISPHLETEGLILFQ